MFLLPLLKQIGCQRYKKNTEPQAKEPVYNEKKEKKEKSF